MIQKWAHFYLIMQKHDINQWQKKTTGYCMDRE